jgi:hypothetical protein
LPSSLKQQYSKNSTFSELLCTMHIKETKKEVHPTPKLENLIRATGPGIMMHIAKKKFAIECFRDLETEL